MSEHRELIGATALLLITALWLFWALRGRKPEFPECLRCRHNLSGTDGSRCPECGRAAKTPRELTRRRRRWVQASIGTVLVLAESVLVLRLTPPAWWVPRAPTVMLIATLGPVLTPAANDMIVQELADRLTWSSGSLAWSRVDEIPRWQQWWLASRLRAVTYGGWDESDRALTYILPQPDVGAVPDPVTLQVLEKTPAQICVEVNNCTTPGGAVAVLLRYGITVPPRKGVPRMKPSARINPVYSDQVVVPNRVVLSYHELGNDDVFVSCIEDGGVWRVERTAVAGGSGRPLWLGTFQMRDGKILVSSTETQSRITPTKTALQVVRTVLTELGANEPVLTAVSHVQIGTPSDEAECHGHLRVPASAEEPVMLRLSARFAPTSSSGAVIEALRTRAEWAIELEQPRSGQRFVPRKIEWGTMAPPGAVESGVSQPPIIEWAVWPASPEEVRSFWGVRK